MTSRTGRDTRYQRLGDYKASAAYIRHQIRTALGSIRDNEIRRLIEGKTTVRELMERARVHAPAVPLARLEDAVAIEIGERVAAMLSYCGECGGPLMLAVPNDVYSAYEVVCASCGLVAED